MPYCHTLVSQMCKIPKNRHFGNWTTKKSLKNQRLIQFLGWQEDAEIKEKSAQLYNVLVNHYNEILAMKDQVKLIKSLLDA